MQMLALESARNAAEMATVHYTSKITQMLFTGMWSRKAEIQTPEVTTWDLIAVLPRACAASVRGAGPTIVTLLMMGAKNVLRYIL
eukprot:12419000-Karenia_brevis.AAC.1